MFKKFKILPLVMFGICCIGMGESKAEETCTEKYNACKNLSDQCNVWDLNKKGTGATGECWNSVGANEGYEIACTKGCSRAKGDNECSGDCPEKTCAQKYNACNDIKYQCNIWSRSKEVSDVETLCWNIISNGEGWETGCKKACHMAKDTDQCVGDCPSRG